MNEENGQMPVPFRVEFTSRMNTRELIMALVWLPIHVFGLPLLGGWLLAEGILTELQANLMIYVAGTVYILLAEFTFLRREYDPLCDHFFYCAIQVLSCYIGMLALNMLSSGILSLLGKLAGSAEELNNLNNDAIMDYVLQERNVTSAMVIYLAPIVEEVLFRGAIFGGIRGKSRRAAYLLSVLLFSVYHVWGYASADPAYWLYLLQYIPAGLMLCRCYEKTNSVWTCIFFHMLTNGIALRAFEEVAELL